MLSIHATPHPLSKPQFLAPPAERQRSFSNTDLSVVRLSVRPSVRPSVKIEGGGLSRKRLSNFSYFLAWSFFGVT